MFNQKETLTLEEAETIVGKSVNLKGNLKSEGDIKVGGNLDGEINTKGSVIILESAIIKGNVNGLNVLISGMVEGNVKAKERLEITETGRVNGDVTCPVLIVNPGGILNGNVHMEVRNVETKDAKKDQNEKKNEERVDLKNEKEEVENSPKEENLLG